MKARLIISCEGRQDDGFSFCSGVQNIILNFDTIKHTKNYRDLIEYIDKIPKLFEGPCFSNNPIMNTIYKLFELGYINEKKYNLITQFFQWHKRCGLCLKILPGEDNGT